MKELTPRDKGHIQRFKETTRSDITDLDLYLSGEWEWDELWDYNFDQVNTSLLRCRCTFEGLRASGRHKGYPRSIKDLERQGCQFTLIAGGGSWYEDAWYQCSCGQKWEETFVEAMQYMGNHARPIDDNEFEQIHAEIETMGQSLASASTPQDASTLYNAFELEADKLPA
ncbi:hypothetical protein [Pseudomaricurvus sp. HS19]|uniref:hypothetical protein n=1 Tax=Pseudomaricurvus sp. HS19 TaxID=2692626 RepID=UPI00136D654D|nr:hypothetical protein [Pseudomaricurvus sp. HS19]MYM63414.1 hypothetical protein [Pseudomaricurvus sp. HS19]